MDKNTVSTDTLEDVIISRLKEAGYKITPKRRIIVREMIEQAGYHFHAKSIYQCVKKKSPLIGTATVFRTVKIIEELGLFDDLFNSFTKKNSNNTLICTVCGRTEYIDDNLPYEISDQVFKDYSFKAQEVNLTVFGKCRNCRDN